MYGNKGILNILLLSDNNYFLLLNGMLPLEESLVLEIISPSNMELILITIR